jgi:hypothetical protein
MSNLKLGIMRRVYYKLVIKDGVTHIVVNEDTMYAQNMKLRPILKGKVYHINKL